MKERKNKMWTAKEVETLMSYCASGKSTDWIAAELNRTPKAINAKRWHFERSLKGIPRTERVNKVKKFTVEDLVYSDWGDEEKVEPVTPKPTTSSIPGTGSAINITPGNVDVKPTVKPVTPKLERVGSRRTVTTGTSNTAVVPAYLSGKPAPKPKPTPTPTYPHHYTVRIPKVLVAAVILVAVGVGGWLIGRGF